MTNKMTIFNENDQFCMSKWRFARIQRLSWSFLTENIWENSFSTEKYNFSPENGPNPKPKPPKNLELVIQLKKEPAWPFRLYLYNKLFA